MELLLQLQGLIPVLGTLTGHEEAAALAARLINIGEEEVGRRIATQNQTREEILEDATRTWEEAVKGADELGRLGHGGPQKPGEER